MDSARIRARSTLELDADETRALGYHVVDLIVDYLAGLKELPVVPPRPIGERAAREPQPVPSTGQDARDVVNEAVAGVFNSIIPVSHPRFFAFVPSPSNVVSIMADALVSAFNPFCGSWLVASGPAEIELVTVEWLRQMCGMPEGAGGLFVSGGSVANLTALAVARHVKLNDQSEGARVYLSDQAHASITKALHLLGFADESIRVLPTDAECRLPIPLLEEAVAGDRANGLRPFCVIGNAGTTNTGAVDPLDDLADLCNRHDLWFHVDGAYGAPAVLTDRGRALLEGLGRADSLVLDPHKWLFQPFEIGCVLVRDMHLLSDTFAVHPEYLRDVDRDVEDVNFRDYGIQLTRSFRALKLWMSLKVFGLDAFREAIDWGMQLARVAQDELRSLPGWEVVTPAQLGIVTFRYAPAGMDLRDADRMQQTLIDGLASDGFAFLTSTVLEGNVVLRLCTINPRTSEDDVRETIHRLDHRAHDTWR